MLTRKLTGTNAKVFYCDLAYSPGQQEQNTNDLAKECRIPVSEAASALLLLYPWVIQ